MGSRSRTAARGAGYIIALVLALFASRAEAADYGYTVASASSVQFYVHGATWADLHYQVNGGAQLNVRMAVSGTDNSYTVGGLSNGASVRYFFTVGASSG
ncbi:MAG TPA: glycoside hydrolase family 16 protein, partial [Kofleriaceae bacterium]